MAQEFADDTMVGQSGGDVGQTGDVSQFSGGNQTLPAVDGVNAKLAVGSVIDGADVSYIEGSVTIPLGHRFGLQIDGVAADFDSDLSGHIPVYALGAHAFWRDPSRGLLGAYADFVHVDSFGGIQSYTAGVEGALYINRFTIDGAIGVQSGDVLDTEFFDNIRVSYYPTDDLNLYIGQSYAFSTNSFNYGAEWAFAGKSRTATALFAQGDVFEGGNHGISAGLRVYFGQRQKSLLRRHREDDPRAPISAPNLVYITISDGGKNTIIIGNTSGGNLTPVQLCNLYHTIC